MVLTEAMAAGAPVLASDLDAFRAVLCGFDRRPVGAGVLFPTGDPAGSPPRWPRCSTTRSGGSLSVPPPGRAPRPSTGRSSRQTCSGSIGRRSPPIPAGCPAGPSRAPGDGADPGRAGPELSPTAWAVVVVRCCSWRSSPGSARPGPTAAPAAQPDGRRPRGPRGRAGPPCGHRAPGGRRARHGPRRGGEVPTLPAVDAAALAGDARDAREACRAALRVAGAVSTSARPRPTRSAARSPGSTAPRSPGARADLADAERPSCSPGASTTTPSATPSGCAPDVSSGGCGWRVRRRCPRTSRSRTPAVRPTVRGDVSLAGVRHFPGRRGIAVSPDQHVPPTPRPRGKHRVARPVPPPPRSRAPRA